MENDFIARSILVGKNGLFSQRGCPGNCQYCRLWTEEGCCVILEAPAADVVEVVHGRWIELHMGELQCPICEEKVMCVGWLTNGKYNYCPNCGAKMDLEEVR